MQSPTLGSVSLHYRLQHTFNILWSILNTCRNQINDSLLNIFLCSPLIEKKNISCLFISRSQAHIGMVPYFIMTSLLFFHRYPRIHIIIFHLLLNPTINTSSLPSFFLLQTFQSWIIATSLDFDINFHLLPFLA
jgi:hypothetical protein